MAPALALAALLVGCGPSPNPARDLALEPWPDAPAGPTVQAAADLTHPETGTMTVVVHYRGLTEEMNSFRAQGWDPEILFDDVHFTTPDGKRIGFDRDGRTFRLSGGPHPDVVVQYEVMPGGNGRHGMQGVVTEDFASFDGRVFLAPRGGGALAAGRVRFVAPDGWVTASALPDAGNGWLSLDGYGPDHVATALMESCYGVGPFEVERRTLGGTEVRAWTFAGFPDKDREGLNRRSMAIFGWFHDRLGFDPGFPLAVVWTPKVDGSRVYGGSSANGTCFEQPKPTTRAWELMAHRLGHSMNKYVPSGMGIRDERDDWFKEGWASWVELAGTKGAGVSPHPARWNKLARDYYATRAEHPERDTPLWRETEVRGYDATEYMHYTKAPIAVAMLDDWLRRRTGRELLDFMALMWKRHGGFRGELALRDELEAWAGESLDAFWAVHVDRRGDFYPVWPEALTPRVRRAARRRPAARVGEMRFSEDYLEWLVENGGYARFADVAAELEREAARHVQLLDAGIALLPPFLEPFRAGLAPAAQAALAASERAWPLAPVADHLPGASLEIDRNTVVGGRFARLLDAERDYAEALGTGGVEAIEARVLGEDGKPGDPVLGFDASDRVRLLVRWHYVPGEVKITCRRGGEVASSRTVTLAPHWHRSWSEFAPDERPEGAGDVTFELELPSGDRIARTFHQRSDG